GDMARLHFQKGILLLFVYKINDGCDCCPMSPKASCEHPILWILYQTLQWQFERKEENSGTFSVAFALKTATRGRSARETNPRHPIPSIGIRLQVNTLGNEKNIMIHSFSVSFQKKPPRDINQNTAQQVTASSSSLLLSVSSGFQHRLKTISSPGSSRIPEPGCDC
ncbi:hypothetical protein STEG23_017344, partial [Scotinomys teguina]